jgi:FkbM family methyltransferase
MAEVAVKRDGRVPGTAAAVARSLRIYRRDPQHMGRLAALYRAFVPPGGLAFDIGAHVGDRIAAFRSLGARVVAAEPQPGPFRALRLLHGRDPDVVLLSVAVAERHGEVVLHVNRANPTVSTASAAFIDAARDAPGWKGQSWDDALIVPATTLDALIAAHGRPDFVKVDVEGFEHLVLAGLGIPVRALSFEFTTIARPVALACIERLATLGDYRFNHVLGESGSFALPAPVDGDQMAAHLAALPHEANSGDVYATLAE